jgi:hypothetical protein
MSLPFLPRSLVTTTLGEEVEAEESEEEEEEVDGGKRAQSEAIVDVLRREERDRASCWLIINPITLWVTPKISCKKRVLNTN